MNVEQEMKFVATYIQFPPAEVGNTVQGMRRVLWMNTWLYFQEFTAVINLHPKHAHLYEEYFMLKAKIKLSLKVLEFDFRFGLSSPQRLFPLLTLKLAGGVHWNPPSVFLV